MARPPLLRPHRGRSRRVCLREHLCQRPGPLRVAGRRGPPRCLDDPEPARRAAARPQRGDADVDLFVGVTSIAADPTWSDRGTQRARTYWDTASFGTLNESAEIRKESLERLLPRTKLAGRARIDDRFLVVDGTRRTYKIHLGSGNILMSPDDSYLCIVADRSTKADTVYLPFEEGGGMLSMILSKAFLLAEDARITDPTILRQLR